MPNSSAETSSHADANRERAASDNIFMLFNYIFVEVMLTMNDVQNTRGDV